MTKKSRWWLIATYCTLAVLVILVVASCFIPVNKKPDIIDPLIYELRVNGVAEPPISANKDDKQLYDEINKVFNDSFSESFLVSLFSGRIGYTNSIRSISKPSTTGYTLYLLYNTEQPQSFVYNNTTYYYDEIRLTVSQDQGMTTHEFYYVCSPDYNDALSTTRYFLQTFVANFDSLYDYFADAQA